MLKIIKIITVILLLTTLLTVTGAGAPNDDIIIGSSGSNKTTSRANEFSNLYLLILENHIPAAPTGLHANVVSASEICLTWTDNSNNSEGFIVERKTGMNGKYEQIVQIFQPKFSDGSHYCGPVSSEDDGIATETTYYYRVLSYNKKGNSSYSNEIKVSTLLATPSNLVATPISLSQIDIKWQDNSKSEDGFIIERKLCYGKFEKIATVPSNATSYSDTGLQEDTPYFYRVKAFDEQTGSDYSGETNASTLKLTVDYLKKVVTKYFDEGSITNYEVYQALISKLTLANESAAKGNLNNYTKYLEEFQAIVKKESGKSITGPLMTEDKK
ncbi:MAG: fibronectin type III domain-containing protein [Planctomycetes bacterium]|nr:fibronectin type III domain-containing protein [Planctomycetota bacterium]